jgi:hypothetical protein
LDNLDCSSLSEIDHQPLILAYSMLTFTTRKIRPHNRATRLIETCSMVLEIGKVFAYDFLAAADCLSAILPSLALDGRLSTRRRIRRADWLRRSCTLADPQPLSTRSLPTAPLMSVALQCCAAVCLRRRKECSASTSRCSSPSAASQDAWVSGIHRAPSASRTRPPYAANLNRSPAARPITSRAFTIILGSDFCPMPIKSGLPR